MDKREQLVNQWITKADHDLGMAELAIANKPEYKDLICFHCQQSAEKYLKAYLVHLNIDFKKSHSTPLLFLVLPGPLESWCYTRISHLSAFGV
jgi:Uncharacterized conserved protein related to C-terminal domain of eukaryotic chaperone, SACSIN